MSKGLRFFGTDYAENAFGGTPDASSREDFAEFAFDGLPGTRWTSENQNTNGNVAFVEMNFGVNRVIDSFYVYNTNIEDVEVQYYSGSAWVTCNTSIATITKSTDLAHLHVKLNASVTTQKIRVTGSNTITADQEKHVTLFHAFLEIGQFEYFPDFTPKITPKQNVFSTMDGRGFVIDRGEQFTAKIKFASHVNQNDINLAEELLDRKEPFFVWPNGGDESLFKFSFRPYRFQDLFKVSVTGESQPKLTKNYYKGGYNNTLNLTEVV